MQKKRTEITIETDRVVVISRRNVSAPAWCRSCGRRVSMFTPDEAARLTRVSSRTIYAWAETGRLHFMEMSDGRLLICSESVPPCGLIDVASSEEPI